MVWPRGGRCGSQGALGGTAVRGPESHGPAVCGGGGAGAAPGRRRGRLDPLPVSWEGAFCSSDKLSGEADVGGPRVQYVGAAFKVGGPTRAISLGHWASGGGRESRANPGSAHLPRAAHGLCSEFNTVLLKSTSPRTSQHALFRNGILHWGHSQATVPLAPEHPVSSPGRTLTQ